MNSIFDGARILVVDDEPDVRALAEDALGLVSESIQIFTASDGREALEIVHRENPDAILTDIMMPVMDGITFLAELRSDSRFLRTPLAVLTGFGSEELTIELLTTGAEAYLQKPITPDLLTSTIHALLRIRHHYQELSREAEKHRNGIARIEEELRRRFGTEVSDEIMDACDIQVF